jgi:hypothetical protein
MITYQLAPNSDRALLNYLAGTIINALRYLPVSEHRRFMISTFRAYKPEFVDMFYTDHDLLFNMIPAPLSRYLIKHDSDIRTPRESEREQTNPSHP